MTDWNIGSWLEEQSGIDHLMPYDARIFFEAQCTQFVYQQEDEVSSAEVLLWVYWFVRHNLREHRLSRSLVPTYIGRLTGLLWMAALEVINERTKGVVQMNSYEANYQYTPRSKAGRKALCEAASTYFIEQLRVCKQRGRIPTNEDLHTWVYKFIGYNLRMGRIHIGRLADDVVIITELLWDVAMDELCGLQEEMQS